MRLRGARGIEAGDEGGKGVAGGRLGEEAAGIGLFAAGEETGEDVEFELEPELVVHGGETEAGEEEQQGFDRGELVVALLRAQLEAARAGHGQTDGATPAIDAAKKIGRLFPAAVDEQHLDVFRARVGRGRFALGMQNPEFTAGAGDGVAVERASAASDVEAGGRKEALDQVARAARAVDLAVVHEHVDPERTVERRLRRADAPARRQAARGTAWAGTGNDGARHGPMAAQGWGAVNGGVRRFGWAARGWSRAGDGEVARLELFS